jgi:hypothetical protein
MKISYTLSKEELEEAIKGAKFRISESAKLGLNHSTTYKRNMEKRIEEETVGIGAEIAWARVKGVEWHNPINEFHSVPDDGVLEIRATSHPRGGLIVRDNDPLDRKYVFASCDKPGGTYVFHGWAYGRDVVQDRNYWNPNGWRPAWRVGRDALTAITNLELGKQIKS